MEKIYICPKCNNKRTLNLCEKCNYELKHKSMIYDFILNKDFKSDFDEIGSQYYQLDEVNIQEELSRLISTLLTWGNVLDLGCGDGAISRSLIKNKYNNLICVDSSNVMLDIFVRKLKGIDYDSSKLTLIRADAHFIPLTNESIDMVIVNNLFHLVNDPIKILNEIKRVLTPNGILLLISEDNGNMYEEFGDEQYEEVTSIYSDKYWEIMKKNNIYPNKINTNFNPYIEVRNLFKYYKVLKTNPIDYFGVKKLVDFISKNFSKSDYSKLHIPNDIHLKAHEEIVNFIKKIYGDKFNEIEINYRGRSTSVIDVYKK